MIVLIINSYNLFLTELKFINSSFYFENIKKVEKAKLIKYLNAQTAQ